MEDITSKIGSGSTPKGSNYCVKGIPFFRSQNIYNYGLVYDDIKYISNEIHKSMNGTIVRPKDLLLNITGGSIGRCAIVPLDFNEGNVSQHVCIIRPILVNSEYLHCYIISDLFWKSMRLTGSGREGLPKYNLEQMLLPLPPLKEQERIICSLNKYLDIISEIENSQDSLSNYIVNAKSKIVDLAMQGKLVPQDPADEAAADMLHRINPKARIITDNPHSWNIPYGWVMVSLKALIDSPSSKQYQIFQSEIKQKGKFPVISQSSNFIEGYSDCCDKAFHPNNGIVIFGDHTKVVKFYSNNFIIGADGVKLIDWNYNKRFLFHLVKYVSERIPNKGYSRHFQYLLKYVVGLPPVKEQKRIVAKIEELYSMLDEIEASLQS